MKKQSKFYLIKVGDDVVSSLGFKYNMYKTSVFELEVFCGFKSKEELYRSAVHNGLHVYTVISVNTSSVFEEMV